MLESLPESAEDFTARKEREKRRRRERRRCSGPGGKEKSASSKLFLPSGCQLFRVWVLGAVLHMTRVWPGSARLPAALCLFSSGRPAASTASKLFSFSAVFTRTKAPRPHLASSPRVSFHGDDDDRPAGCQYRSISSCPDRWQGLSLTCSTEVRNLRLRNPADQNSASPSADDQVSVSSSFFASQEQKAADLCFTAGKTSFQLIGVSVKSQKSEIFARTCSRTLCPHHRKLLLRVRFVFRVYSQSGSRCMLVETTQTVSTSSTNRLIVCPAVSFDQQIAGLVCECTNAEEGEMQENKYLECSPSKILNLFSNLI